MWQMCEDECSGKHVPFSNTVCAYTHVHIYITSGTYSLGRRCCFQLVEVRPFTHCHFSKSHTLLGTTGLSNLDVCFATLAHLLACVGFLFLFLEGV